MSLLKKLAGETAIYGISSILGRILNFVIMTPYLTRVFTEAEYGVVGVFYAWAGFLIVLFTYRMETTFFRFAQKQETRENGFSTAAWTIIITTIVFWCLLFGFSQPIANYLQYPNSQSFVIYFALIIGFDALVAIPFARLRLEGKAMHFAAVKVANVLINAFFILFFLEACPWLIGKGYEQFGLIFNPENRIAYIFIANLLASAFTIVILLPIYKHLRRKIDFALWKRMMRYTLPLVVVGFAGIINQLLDRLLLERMLPGTLEENAAQVGIYTGCYKFAILLALFTQAFNYAAEPFFFNNADRSDSKKIYAQVAQGFTIIGCLGFLCILLYMDILQIAIGENFRVGLKIVPILLMANLFLGIYYNFSIWYKLTDKTIMGAYISTVGAFITIAINISLIPVFGYMASAWAAFACYFTMATLSYLIGRKHYPVPYPIFKMLGYIGLAVVIFWLNTLIRQQFGDGTAMLYLLNTLLIISFLAVTGWSFRKELVKG